jgi:hypothetical protein
MKTKGTDMTTKKPSTRKSIGLSPLTDRVYLGRQNKEKGLWIGEKEDITSDFVNLMLQFIKDDEYREIVNQKTSEKEYFILKVKNTKEDIKEWIENLKALLEELKSEN